MLPPEHRLRARADFTAVLRAGRRAGRPLLSLHLLAPDAPSSAPPRAGLVVSRAVGGSVARHRTARRLRHLLAPRLEQLPPGSRLVVRAAPGAGTADSPALAEDLDRALERVLGAGRRLAATTGASR